MSQKNCAELFLSQLLQISTNFDNFWQKDGKEAKIMQGALIFTLPNLCHHTTVLSADVPNCYTTLTVVSIRLLTIASSIK